jgi:hypothetical protein
MLSDYQKFVKKKLGMMKNDKRKFSEKIKEIAKLWKEEKGKGKTTKKKTKEIKGGGLGDIAKIVSKKAFKTVANAIRKSDPNSRPLEDGELHVGYENYCGPGM